MKPSRFRPTPGRRAAASLVSTAAAAGTLLLGACSYGLSGGGGFPAAIHTVCIEPFENTTDRAELTNELFTALNQKVPSALGLRQGDCKGGADAVIRGKIVGYNETPANYSASIGSTTTPQQQTNQVNVTLAVQIIDSKRNVLLWDGSSVQGMGTYQPPNDAAGRKLAVEKVVQAIIDGAQSQW